MQRDIDGGCGLSKAAGRCDSSQTSAGRQGQNCTAFKVKMNYLNLMWKENKRGGVSNSGASGILEMVFILFLSVTS